MTFRSKPLLLLCREAPCMLRLTVPCGNDSSVACHSDMLKHGRGVGHKSGDQFIVPGCPNCHARFTREFLGRDQYAEIWLQAYERFQTWAWENEKVKVA